MGGVAECRLVLHQRLSGLSATLGMGGPTRWSGTVMAEISGEQPRVEMPVVVVIEEEWSKPPAQTLPSRCHLPE